jgi:cytidylate kinase
MPLITIRGQMGSGAHEVGQLLAKKLNLDFVDREIIDMVAGRLNHETREIARKEMPPGTFLGRIAEALQHAYPPGVGYPANYPGIEVLPEDARYLESLTSVINELAASGDMVIQGRGSQFILKDHPGALHILLVAPPNLRIKRVMERLPADEKTARKEIERYDSSRREFIKRYFHAELEDPVHYSMTINTERFSFEDTASIIINALAKKKPHDR